MLNIKLYKKYSDKYNKELVPSIILLGRVVVIEDLDLEFEFEDDSKIEKSDAIDVGVDLDFSAHPKSKLVSEDRNVKKVLPKPTPKPAPDIQGTKQTSPKVKNISDARQKKETPPPIKSKSLERDVAERESQSLSTTILSDQHEDHYLELDALRQEISDLKELVGSVKSNADVKVAVAQARSEFLIQYVSDAKLLDHQVNQMLSRIHKKVPQLKNDVLSIKKYMSDFLAKTKK
jgi:hypothetical protein